MTNEVLSPTESNALKWVLLMEWCDKYRDDKDYATLLPYRVAILRGDR